MYKKLHPRMVSGGDPPDDFFQSKSTSRTHRISSECVICIPQVVNAVRSEPEIGLICTIGTITIAIDLHFPSGSSRSDIHTGTRLFLSMKWDTLTHTVFVLLNLLEVVLGLASGQRQPTRSPTIPMLGRSISTSLSSMAG